MEKIENIVRKAIQEIASDIYITGGHPVVARRRGTIEFNNSVRFSHQEVDDLVRKFLNYDQLTVLRERKSFDLAISLCGARLRINIFTTARGLSLAIRILPGNIPSIEELNLHPSLHEIARLKNGLVLSCGATGVGKTTTIAAIINEINLTRPAHVVTLEDPIEFRFPTIRAFIQQRELGAHMSSFAQGLLDVLRENPDVIVVGELREPEVIQLTINAAEAGHLVIATLHASTPEEAIYRLCNSVPIESQNEIRNQIASTLQWLVVQQLVYVEKVGFQIPVLTILRANSSLRNLIRENKLQQVQNVLLTGKSEGMFTSERYLNEYLNSDRKFIRPDIVFRPSVETTKDPVYSSALVDGRRGGTLPMRQSSPVTSPSTAMEPILVRDEYTGGDGEHVLNLDEHGESLNEVIRKLHEEGT
jgi:twitching motility protein PilT